jgi:hypothetical protein
MTASRLGLAILTAVAVVLALVVALEPPRVAVSTARPLVPGLEADAVVRLVVRGPDSAVELARGDGGWAVIAPAPGPADGPAVADLLSALAVARWDRVVRDPDSAATGLASPRRSLEVTTATRTTRIAVGAAVTATGQVWVRVDDGPPLLVPGWVATAVDRDLGALRQQRLAPVAPAEVTAVELHGPGLDLVLSGAPLAIRGEGWTARAAPERVSALLAAITGLAAVAFPPADAVPGPDGLAVRVLGGAAPVELVERGTCEGGRVRVDGSAGAACVEAAAWQAIRDAASGAGSAAWIDPRPAAGAVSVALARTGVTLRRQGGVFTVEAAGETAPADPDAGSRLLAALAAPGRVVAAPAGGDVVATAVDAAGATTVLHAAGPSRLRRDREPFALVVDAAVLAALAADAGALRSRQLVSAEATALVRLVVTRGGRSATLERGAVIGEWTGAGALPAAAIDAAAAALADLRAARRGAGTGGLDLRVEATFEAAPVAGARPATHSVELATGDCRARVDGAAVVLEPAACSALRALAPLVR